jgi:hypothetical protein
VVRGTGPGNDKADAGHADFCRLAADAALLPMVGIITEFVVVRPLAKSIAGIFGMSMS